MSTNKYIALLFILILLASCSDDESESNDNIDYRQEMRNFVIGISNYAKSTHNNFLIIPQNGQELLTFSGDPEGSVVTEYVNAVDATGREDLFYGYNFDDVETPTSDRNYLLELCSLWEENHIEVLTTDYCFNSESLRCNLN